ncbi:NADP-dependent malic enzyme [Arachis hypogaea]|nr:NADP-dependent malic enzyme [Arachis hypogaea]
MVVSLNNFFALSFDKILLQMDAKTLGSEDYSHQKEEKHADLIKSLKSSMDNLNKELEKMKKENSTPSEDGYSIELTFPNLQRELVQLHEANQEWENIFPVFKEISVIGNALERVLALEIELAEALQAKKKSSMQFQRIVVILKLIQQSQRLGTASVVLAGLIAALKLVGGNLANHRFLFLGHPM